MRTGVLPFGGKAGKGSSCCVKFKWHWNGGRTFLSAKTFCKAAKQQREGGGDRYTRWLTSITLIETRSLRIYLHQLQILLFCPARFFPLQIMMKMRIPHRPPTPWYVCVGCVKRLQLGELWAGVEKEADSEAETEAEAKAKAMAKISPKYVYLSDRKLAQFFLSFFRLFPR